jgi:hypothetical protein
MRFLNLQLIRTLHLRDEAPHLFCLPPSTELAECNPMYFAAEYHCPKLPAANRFPYELLTDFAPVGCFSVCEEFISLRGNHRGGCAAVQHRISGDDSFVGHSEADDAIFCS